MASKRVKFVVLSMEDDHYREWSNRRRISAKRNTLKLVGGSNCPCDRKQSWIKKEEQGKAKGNLHIILAMSMLCLVVSGPLRITLTVNVLYKIAKGLFHVINP